MGGSRSQARLRTGGGRPRAEQPPEADSASRPFSDLEELVLVSVRSVCPENGIDVVLNHNKVLH